MKGSRLLFSGCLFGDDGSECEIRRRRESISFINLKKKGRGVGMKQS